MNSKAFLFTGVSLTVLVIILGIAEIVFLSKIEPYNYVFAAIVFIIAIVMAVKVFSARAPKEASVQQQKEPETIEFRPQELSAEEFIESSKATGEEEGKMSLDEFILSSPKEFKEKKAEESTEKKLDEIKSRMEEPEEKIELGEGELKEEVPEIEEMPKKKTETKDYEIIKPKSKTEEKKSQATEYEEMKKKAFKELKKLVEEKEE